MWSRAQTALLRKAGPWPSGSTASCKLFISKRLLWRIVCHYQASEMTRASSGVESQRQDGSKASLRSEAKFTVAISVAQEQPPPARFTVGCVGAPGTQPSPLSPAPSRSGLGGRLLPSGGPGRLRCPPITPDACTACLAGALRAGPSRPEHLRGTLPSHDAAGPGHGGPACRVDADGYGGGARGDPASLRPPHPPTRPLPACARQLVVLSGYRLAGLHPPAAPRFRFPQTQ